MEMKSKIEKRIAQTRCHDWNNSKHFYFTYIQFPINAETYDSTISVAERFDALEIK